MKILYVSLIDWYFTKQRPHHIVQNLSKYHNVVFCSAVYMQKKDTNKHDNDDKFKRSFQVNSNLKINRYLLLPYSRFQFVRIFNKKITKRYYLRSVKHFKPDLIILSHPEQYEYFKNTRIPIAYDCMDNYVEFKKTQKQREVLSGFEDLLLNRSILNFVSSHGLASKIINRAKGDVLVVNNATDYSVFGYKSNIEYKRPIEIVNLKNIVGYFGGISSWFNVDLIIQLAQNRPNYNFVIIGPKNNVDLIKASRTYLNIHLLGPKTYNELPYYLYCFDVCIMPFIINDLIMDVNPVKIYEYLSMGKPVVAPYYPELCVFSDLIYTARSNGDFLLQVDLAMVEDLQEIVLKRIEFAQKNTWEVRSNQIHDKITTYFDKQI